jgi:16S rRNA (cytidine1402-2'-O)-methyltransferase
VAEIAAGKSVALISDAGTPLVSDPGYKLVRDCLEAGVAVTAIPGACAAIQALCTSGLATDAFHFAGFLPQKAQQRRKAIEALRPCGGTLVFYEAPGRVHAALTDLRDGLGERPAAVARELTKRFEETLRGSLGELAARTQSQPPRGECVILVGPASEEDGAASREEVVRLLGEALREGSVRDASQSVSEATGWPRKQVYALALELRAAGEDGGEGG